MYVEVITTEGERVLGLNMQGGPVPAAGDVFQLPDNRVFRCLQRTFLFRQPPVTGLFDIKAGRPVEIAIQCVVQYVGNAQEDGNAIIQ